MCAVLCEDFSIGTLGYYTLGAASDFVANLTTVLGLDKKR
jgi:hypothetical protein